jgi:hypothetical protein
MDQPFLLPMENSVSAWVSALALQQERVRLCAPRAAHCCLGVCARAGFAQLEWRDSPLQIGSERSSAWLEHLLWEQDVAGSNPVAPTTSLQRFSALSRALTMLTMVSGSITRQSKR